MKIQEARDYILKKYSPEELQKLAEPIYNNTLIKEISDLIGSECKVTDLILSLQDLLLYYPEAYLQDDSYYGNGEIQIMYKKLVGYETEGAVMKRLALEYQKNVLKTQRVKARALTMKNKARMLEEKERAILKELKEKYDE